MDNKIVIIENDDIYAERIKVILLQFEIVKSENVVIFDNVNIMIDYCNRHKPDLIISDIYLEGSKTGIDLLSLLKYRNIPIILMTSSIDISLYERVKQIETVNYLIKPIQPLTLISVIESLLEREMLVDKVKEPSIFVKGLKNQQFRVYFHEMLWIESFGNYCTIMTTSTKHCLKISLKTLMLQLDKRFVRCHQQYLVNVDVIKKIDNDFISLPNEAIPVGRTYRNQILSRLPQAC